jgi:hypothetical protein
MVTAVKINCPASSIILKEARMYRADFPCPCPDISSPPSFILQVKRPPIGGFASIFLSCYIQWGGEYEKEGFTDSSSGVA